MFGHGTRERGTARLVVANEASPPGSLAAGGGPGTLPAGRRQRGGSGHAIGSMIGYVRQEVR